MLVKIYISTYFLVLILGTERVFAGPIKKRQIYREQVSPHIGGKIPDTAFETDRLALNRLQKEGIAVPDGVILEQRNPQVHQFPHKSLRPVLKVHAIDDGRFTDTSGQYLHETPLTHDTTYPVPRITYETIDVPPKLLVHQPVLKHLILPSHIPSKSYYKENAYTPLFHQSLSSPFSNYNFAIGFPNKWNRYSSGLVPSYASNDIHYNFDAFKNEIPHH